MLQNGLRGARFWAMDTPKRLDASGMLVTYNAPNDANPLCLHTCCVCSELITVALLLARLA